MMKNPVQAGLRAAIATLVYLGVISLAVTFLGVLGTAAFAEGLGHPKDDPQTEHGKDCDVHGNHGGVNEDHCLTTTTTTQPPTTTTTTPTPESPTTTTTTTATGGSPSTTTTDSSSVSDVTPYLGCVTPDGYPYKTNIEQGGCPSSLNSVSSQNGEDAPFSELPRTGWDADLLFVVGTGLLLAGLSCWFAGKAID